MIPYLFVKDMNTNTNFKFYIRVLQCLNNCVTPQCCSNFSTFYTQGYKSDHGNINNPSKNIAARPT